MGQERRIRMHARPVKRRNSRLPRLMVALLMGELLAVLPVAAFAAPPASHQELSVSAAVATSDCNDVVVDFAIDWRGIRGGADGNIASVELQAVPGDFFLTSIALEPGRKTDKQRGHIEGQLLRESGYFDHQTYPGLSYQVAVNTTAGGRVTSDPVAIPGCVPMSPTSGPAEGGTAVTIYGGGTFGGPVFTIESTVTLAGSLVVSPKAVASDGSSLTFVTPAGSAGTCISVATEPGLPFPLPNWCFTG